MLSSWKPANFLFQTAFAVFLPTLSSCSSAEVSVPRASCPPSSSSWLGTAGCASPQRCCQQRLSLYAVRSSLLRGIQEHLLLNSLVSLTLHHQARCWLKSSRVGFGLASQRASLLISYCCAVDMMHYFQQQKRKEKGSVTVDVSWNFVWNWSNKGFIINVPCTLKLMLLAIRYFFLLIFLRYFSVFSCYKRTITGVTINAPSQDQ